MKRLIKYLILAVIVSVTITLIGLDVLNTFNELELAKSTYTRTLFDYHVTAPSKEQSAALERDSATDIVFPYYAYKKAFSNDKITLLVSDEMHSLDASVLTEGTLIEGEANKSGAMLDKTAADALGVGVGDTVSFSLLGNRFTMTVGAIYLPSVLPMMEDGIVAVAMTDEMLSLGLPAAYSGAFVVSNDKSATGAYLSDYVGEGNVALTFEQYVSLNCSSKTPGQTDEEYRELCESKYATYREEALASAKRGGGQVLDKDEAYSLVKEKILTRENELKKTVNLTMIASFFAVIVLTMIFAVSGVGNDRIRRDHGVYYFEMYLIYAGCTLLVSIAAFVSSFIIISVKASQGYFLSDFVLTAFKICFPSGCAAIPTLLLLPLYLNRLYKSSAY